MRWSYLLAVPALIVIVVVVQLLRPIPPITMQVTAPTSFTAQGPSVNVPWPTAGQSALAISGVGLVGSSGATAPQPIASLAKMMVAYVVLQDHPLPVGQDGPTVAVTAQDVALYQSDLKSGQSVVPVAAGESLTERQMLEGLLLPSGNNIASLMAAWDAGSESAFVAKMNAEAKSLGMTNTHYADASGLSAATVSTAVDQLKVAEAAMNIQAFAETAALPQATLPVAGLVYNVDGFLGRSGIIGVKTGSTTAAGGCFVAAANATVAGKQVLVLAAVLGQGGIQPLNAALTAGESLVNSAKPLLTTVQPVAAGQVAATLTAPWAAPVHLTVASSPTFIGWNGFVGSERVTGTPSFSRSVPNGAAAGTLAVTLGQQQAALPLKTSGSINPPGLRWRLTRR